MHVSYQFPELNVCSMPVFLNTHLIIRTYTRSHVKSWMKLPTMGISYLMLEPPQINQTQQPHKLKTPHLCGTGRSGRSRSLTHWWVAWIKIIITNESISQAIKSVNHPIPQCAWFKIFNLHTAAPSSHSTFCKELTTQAGPKNTSTIDKLHSPVHCLPSQMEWKSQNEKHPKTPKASRTIMGWKPLSDFQLAWYNAANAHFSLHVRNAHKSSMSSLSSCIYCFGRIPHLPKSTWIYGGSDEQNS